MCWSSCQYVFGTRYSVTGVSLPGRNPAGVPKTPCMVLTTSALVFRTFASSDKGILMRMLSRADSTEMCEVGLGASGYGYQIISISTIEKNYPCFYSSSMQSVYAIANLS